MIDYINGLLLQWSRWARVRRDGGLGFSSSSPVCRLMAGGSGGRGDLVGVDEQSLEIDLIVARMRRERSMLADVVELFYLDDSVIHSIASRLGCHRDTVYVRLHQAHQFVMDAMHDNDLAQHDQRLMQQNAIGLKKVA